MNTIKKYTAILFFLIISAGVYNFTYAATEHLSYILNHPHKFDKKVVILKGEIIGEALRDDRGGTWINILNAGYNIGVYAHNPDVFKNIKNFGAYGRKGDIVKVKGIFYKNCPFHAERGIHAYSAEVIKKGYLLKESVSAEKEFISFLLSIICLTLVVIYFIKFEYARRH